MTADELIKALSTAKAEQDASDEAVALRTALRKELVLRHGLSPDVAELIPLGTPEMMEEHTKRLAASIAESKEKRQAVASSSVAAYMRNTYPGPRSRGRQ